MMRFCNGCRYQLIESWPRNLRAARCMREGPRQGRVLEIYTKAAGDKPLILRPSWCEGHAPVQAHDK